MRERDKLIGLDAVERRLDRIGDAAKDISPTFPTLAGKFAARESTVFASNGWGQWALRAPSTLREGISPLVQTGIMREGLIRPRPIWHTKHGAAFGADKADRRVMNVAVLNTVGHKQGSRDVPPRPVVPRLRAGEKRDWIDVIRKHMREAIR